MTRRLALTEAGRDLLPTVSAAFDRFAEAAERIGGHDGNRTLTVSLTPSFGARWLVRRLGRFWARHPEIDLRLHHTIDLVDLRHHTLLHEEHDEDWAQWLTAAGAGDIDPRRGPVIDDPSVLDRATLEGQGVALGRTDLLAEHLAAGRLVRPFALDLDTDYADYVVYPRKALDRAKVRAFSDFVLAEAAAERAPRSR